MKPKMRLARVVLPPALAGDGRNRRWLFGNRQVEVLQGNELLAGPQKAAPVNFGGVADFQKGLGHKRLSGSRISTGDRRRNGLAAAPAAVAPLPGIYPSQRDSGAGKMQPGGGRRRSCVRPSVTTSGLRSFTDGIEARSSWV